MDQKQQMSIEKFYQETIYHRSPLFIKILNFENIDSGLIESLHIPAKAKSLKGSISDFKKKTAKFGANQHYDNIILWNIDYRLNEMRVSHERRTGIPMELTLAEKRLNNWEEQIKRKSPPNKKYGSFPKVKGTGVNSECILGPNGTKISFANYCKVQWTSPQEATRSLLRFVFNDDELATHTLSGKPSPAFHNRRESHPEKSKLNPARVKDIIICVLNKVGGKEQVIRATITTKCADMAKKMKRHEVKQLQQTAETITTLNQRIPKC